MKLRAEWDVHIGIIREYHVLGHANVNLCISKLKKRSCEIFVLNVLFCALSPSATGQLAERIFFLRELFLIRNITSDPNGSTIFLVIVTIYRILDNIIRY